MKYLFYPGCSADASAIEYKKSTLAALAALGAEVEELDDWTCCGASVAPATSELLGHALTARNLALAEQAGGDRDLLVICSACYTNFRRTAGAAAKAAERARINRALEVEGLVYHGSDPARHIMDILARDFTPEEIAARVRRPLTGLTVAPYYGCQTVRPFSPFDDSQRPNSMVAVIEALGAAVVRHPHEASCCGTSLMMTKPQVGVKLAATILEAASEADCIATVCPMCHMNMDAYQDKASRHLGKSVNIPVLYLPQLMGLAFDLPLSDLLLERHITSVEPILARLRALQPQAE